MLKAEYPYWLGGRPVAGKAKLEVTNKYTGEAVTRVGLAGREVVEEAIGLAAKAAGPMRRMAPYKRQEALNHVVEGIAARHEEFSETLAIEAGKPIRDARGEVTRSLDTFRIAAEESVRIYGEYQPLEISPRADGYEAIWKRVPVGPCAFITPFNFPLNLAAHKVAPALATGCPFVLKPARLTPVTSLMLGEILAEAGLPEGAFSILPCGHEAAEPMVTDDRLKLLSFTGSPEVGWGLKARSGKKRVLLELGGNAGCIVEADADLDFAAKRIITGAFYQSGQSCISVQRIYIHESVYDEMRERLVAAASALKWGDPLNEETFLGPLITEEDAVRVEAWVKEAVTAGAKVACGGTRHGVFYEPTLLEDVDPKQKVSCVEVFGPVATMEPYSNFQDACARINDSVYGLQAGVFARDIHKVFWAFNELEVGGVVANDIPSMRVDSMPYGGVKNSGLGREGIRFAIEEMTEIRLLVLNRIGREESAN